MASRGREFGEYYETEFPGISPALVRPGSGTEPAGFEGIALPALGVNLVGLQNQQLREQQEAQNAARLAIVPEEEKPFWEKNFTFGAVKRPEQETLRGYKRLLRKGIGDQDIQFSPKKYSIFDGVIVDKSGNENGKSLNPAFNPDHPFYESYAPLRRNIAILRNFILVKEFPDAEYKPDEKSTAGKEDNANYQKVLQMADKLGNQLAMRPPNIIFRFFRSLKRLVLGEDLATPTTDAFIAAANVPDKGIQVLYNYLYGLQSKPTLGDFWPFATTPRTWGLLPAEQTPFSQPNMTLYSRASVTQGIAAEFDRVMAQLRSVDTLSTDTKKISVDYAREILERLKNLIGNKYEESILGQTSNPHEDEAWMLLRAARSYKDVITDIAQIDITGLQNNPMLKDALLALDQINYRIKAEALMMMKEENRPESAKLLAYQMSEMPESAKTNVPLSQLVSTLKTGLNEATRIRQSLLARSVMQQQNLAQQRTQAAIKKAAVTGEVPVTVPRTGPGISAPKAAANIATAAQTFQTARIAQANNARVADVQHHIADAEHERQLLAMQQDAANKGKGR